MFKKQVFIKGAVCIAIAILVVGTVQFVGATNLQQQGITDPEAKDTSGSKAPLAAANTMNMVSDSIYTIRAQSTATGGEGLRGIHYNQGVAVRGYGGSTSWAGYFAGKNGVYGYSGTSGGDAVYGYVPSGLSDSWASRFRNLSTSVGARAIYAYSAGYTALYARTAKPTSYWDGYFPGGGIYAASYTSGSSMATIAYNAGHDVLVEGDLVAVAGVTMAPDGQPVLEVRKATRADAAVVVGVVSGKFVVETGTILKEEILHAATDESQERAETSIMTEFPLDNYKADGPVAPGEYAILATSGLAQVSAAQLDLGRAETGSRAVSRGGISIGLLADAEPDADGLVWVFVDF